MAKQFRRGSQHCKGSNSKQKNEWTLRKGFSEKFGRWPLTSQRKRLSKGKKPKKKKKRQSNTTGQYHRCHIRKFSWRKSTAIVYNFCNFLASQDSIKLDPWKEYNIKWMFSTKCRDFPQGASYGTSKKTNVTATLRECNVFGVYQGCCTSI